MNKETQQRERYHDMLEKGNSTIDLLNNIKQSQKRRKFKLWFKKCWNKITLFKIKRSDANQE